MIVNLVRWMQENLGPAWDSLWDMLGPYLHLVKPGHEPFIVLSEAAVNPRGLWLTSKLPVSYYSNNTVFYHWPKDLETWVDWFSNVSLTEQISDVFSYNILTCATFLQSPYWCQFSFWDVLCWGLTGFPNINLPWDSFHQITLTVGSLFEIVILYNPMYYDQTWDDWFLKISEFNGRWGVSLDQIQHRLFFQSFLVGYWLYFVSDTPWPWRMGYSLNLSNWRWLNSYINFFRTFNEVNPFVLRISFVLIALSFVLSNVTNYSFWIVSFHELTFNCASLWLEFLCISVMLWIPLARLANILHVRVNNNSAFLTLISDIVCAVVPLSRSRVIRVFQNVWQAFSFLFTLFLIYCLAPIWLPLIKWVLSGVGAFIHVLSWGVNWVNDLLVYIFTSLIISIWGFCELGETILGSFFVELVRPYEYYFMVVSGYSFFLLRLIPIICILLTIYTAFIIWPLLNPFINRNLILAVPWAFVDEVPLLTRVKYGLFLVRSSINNFGIN